MKECSGVYSGREPRNQHFNLNLIEAANSVNRPKLVQKVLPVKRIALGRTESGIADHVAQLFSVGAVSLKKRREKDGKKLRVRSKRRENTSKGRTRHGITTVRAPTTWT